MGPGGSQLAASVPRLELFIHHMFWEIARVVMWIVPLSWRGGESDIRRPLSSLVGHGRVLVTIVISVGGTWSPLGVIAVCHVQIRWVEHFFVAKGSVNSWAVLGSGTKVIASVWEGLRSIAANWAGVRECRMMLFGKITGRLLTGGAVVRCKRVFRVAILRASMASIAGCRGGTLR